MDYHRFLILDIQLKWAHGLNLKPMSSWTLGSSIHGLGMNHMGELGVAYGGGGQLVSQDVGISSPSLG